MIRRTVSQATTGPPEIRNTTKRRKLRSVSLLPEVVSALKVDRARQNEKRLALGELSHNQGLVFPGSAGGVVRRENLSRRHFKLILEKAGV